jgi:hypothetical protein
MIDEETSVEIDLLRNTVQPTIVQSDRGFFTKNDGYDLDIGLCKNNGKIYLSIKVDGEWRFAETKLAREI